jgi:hypothetical protein
MKSAVYLSPNTPSDDWEHWEQYINSGGVYFEGDKTYSDAGMSKMIIENSSRTF